MNDTPTPQTALARGIEVIRTVVDKLGDEPGVYRMLNAEGQVLYVGKARSLKKRVVNYTRLTNQPYRIQRMISHTASMEIVQTKNEGEALLVEANLIKQFQPRYNILLKDDKSYPYIRIDTEHDYPRIAKYRGQKKPGAEYYGPYASAGAVNQAIATLQKAFLLRPCTDSIFRDRTRPCLQYQIKRCSAPCVGYVDRVEYDALLDQARSFLTGKSQEVQKELSRQMDAASADMQYEKAAAMRDRIKALTKVQTTQRLYMSNVRDADIVALTREGDVSCIFIGFYRSSQHYGNRVFFPRMVKDVSDAEVMAAFLSQFYQAHSAPSLVLVNILPDDSVMMEQAFSQKESHKVSIHAPSRGEKHQAVTQATQQSGDALQRKLSESASIRTLLEGVKALFDLDDPPERIEVYDNSHVMGAHSVGGMIVAGPEGFMPSEYRKFTIRGIAQQPGDAGMSAGDDYGMMREVLARRFRAREGKDAEKFATFPDLLLIDGGRGQLSVAQQTLAEMGIDIPLVGIAKGPDRNAGREQFYLPERTPFTLPPDDAVLHYLQRLRDEAHRYAIGTHRKKRAKSMVASALDSIPGVGPKRKKALLHHFGSVRQIEQASLNDLADVEGVNQATADVIYNYFHAGE